MESHGSTTENESPTATRKDAASNPMKIEITRDLFQAQQRHATSHDPSRLNPNLNRPTRAILSKTNVSILSTDSRYNV